MPQAEILKYLKIQERCRSSQLTRKLESLVMEYQDRFAVYVGAMPAQIEPFRIEIDESKWEALRPEKYVTTITSSTSSRQKLRNKSSNRWLNTVVAS